MKSQNIINEFWQHIENQNTKIAKRIYNWLNHDNLASIIVDGKLFWLEKTCSTSTIPNFAYTYIKKWASKKNLTYLYDLK